MTFFVIQRDSLERTDRVSVLSTAGALGAPLPILKEKLMSNVAGAQAQANRHAGRNTSDIDELRDNIADIASSVGDMASYQYEQCRRDRPDVRRNPLASIGVGLGVGFLLGLILTGGRTQRA